MSLMASLDVTIFCTEVQRYRGTEVIRYIELCHFHHNSFLHHVVLLPYKCEPSVHTVHT